MKRSLSLAAVLLPLLASPSVLRAQGTPVGPEFQVNTYTTGSQYFPRTASDSSGNFVVVWESYQDGSNAGIFGQRYASSGARLGSEFLINTYTTGFQQHPAVSSDALLDFVVVWESSLQDGSNDGIFGQRYASSGARLGSEFLVNTYTTYIQRRPAVSSDVSGDFVVVWDSFGPDGSGYGIFGQRYASSGAALGSEFRVNTFTTSYQKIAAVSSDALGNFVVVWESYGQDGPCCGAGFGIFGQRFASSGGPLGSEFRVNSYTTDRQYLPAVSMNASGAFVVVWSSNGQDAPALFFGNFGVFGQRYASSGAPLGPEFLVNTYTTGNQRKPRVASDSSGNFVVVWDSDQQDGSPPGVFGQRFASSGAPLGSEFQVNTFTTDFQDTPDVAADPSGDFVVVWESRSQDGLLSYFGVFGQRYGKILPVELIRFTAE